MQKGRQQILIYILLSSIVLYSLLQFLSIHNSLLPQSKSKKNQFISTISSSPALDQYSNNNRNIPADEQPNSLYFDAENSIDFANEDDQRKADQVRKQYLSSMKNTNTNKESATTALLRPDQNQHHSRKNQQRRNPELYTAPHTSSEKQKENHKELKRLLRIRKRLERKNFNHDNKKNDNGAQRYGNNNDRYSVGEFGDMEQRTDYVKATPKWRNKVKRNSDGQRMTMRPPPIENISACYSTIITNTRKSRFSLPTAEKVAKIPKRSYSSSVAVQKSTKNNNNIKPPTKNHRQPRFAVITLHSRNTTKQKAFSNFNGKTNEHEAVIINDNTTRRTIMQDLSFLNKLQYCQTHNIDLIVEGDDIVDSNRSPHWSKLRAIRLHIERYDWILWMDADAFFFNFSYKFEHFVEDQVTNYLLKELANEDRIVRRVLGENYKNYYRDKRKNNNDNNNDNSEDHLDVSDVSSYDQNAFDLLCATFQKRSIDIILTSDFFGINTGVVFYKNSNFTLNFLQTLWSVDPHKAAPFHEQGAFRYALRENSRHREEIAETRSHFYFMKDNIMNAYPSEMIPFEKFLGYSFDEARGWIVHFPGCRLRHNCLEWMHYYYHRAACENYDLFINSFISKSDAKDWFFLFDSTELFNVEKEAGVNDTSRSITCDHLKYHFRSPSSFLPPHVDDKNEIDNNLLSTSSRSFVLEKLMSPYDENYVPYSPPPSTTTEDPRYTKTVHPNILRDRLRRQKMMEKLDEENKKFFVRKKNKET